MNIREQLLDLFDFKETDETFNTNPIYRFNDNISLYTIAERTVQAENLDKNIKADFILFATRHSAKSEFPCLTVHSPGLWNEEHGHGGKSFTVNKTNHQFLKQAYLELKKVVPAGFEVTNECTHHGPETSAKTSFIEIGSSEKQWPNKQAGEAIAKTIMKVLQQPPENYEIAIGLGGTHYCTNFNKIIERTN